MSVLVVNDYELHGKLTELSEYFDKLVEDNNSLADDLTEANETIEELQGLLKSSRIEVYKVKEELQLLKNEVGDIDK